MVFQDTPKESELVPNELASEKMPLWLSTKLAISSSIKSFIKFFRETALEKIEYAFAFYTFFLYTDAITMVVLSNGASEGDGFSYEQIDFTPVQLLRAVNYLLTLIFVICRYKRSIYILLSNPIFVATNVLIGLSYLWSVTPAVSQGAGMFIVLNALFGVYMAGRFTLKQQVIILGYVWLTIAVLNFIFIFFLPQYGVMGPPVHTGAWRGVFTHKNGAGKMMVLACAVLFTLFNESKYKPRKWMYGIGIYLSLVMINYTGSNSALINSMFVMGLVLAIQIFRTRVHKFVLGLVVMASMAIIISINYDEIMMFALLALGKDPTFSGRTEIWEFVGDMIRIRPVLGWGVAAFWHGMGGEGSRYIIERAGWLVPDSHQGFLDMILQIGYVGASMVCLSLWLTFNRGLARVRLFKTWVSGWPSVAMLYIVFANLSESSLLAPNSIFWILISSMCFTMSFEAKYLMDFDRFGLIQKDKIMGRIESSTGVHTKI